MFGRLGSRCVSEVSSSAVLQLLFLVGVHHGRTIEDKKSNAHTACGRCSYVESPLLVEGWTGRGWNGVETRWLGVESADFCLPLLGKHIPGIIFGAPVPAGF